MNKILLVLFLSVPAFVQAEDYHFTVYPKCDSIVVYDVNKNVVFKYMNDTLFYHGNHITQTKVGKTIVFSDVSGEIGKVASKKYKKISLSDSSLYSLKSGNRKLSYKKDGIDCATAQYSFNKTFLWTSTMYSEIFVEMNTSDTKFAPILFFAVFAHIKGTIIAEGVERQTMLMNIVSLFEYL